MAGAEDTSDEGKSTTRTCPTCGNPYPPYVSRCPDDGTLLRDGMPEADPEPNTIAGTTIDGRYYVGQLIGKGAMGRVYRGVQLSVGRQVAIKVLRKKLTTDRDVRKRFLREAKLIAEFKHPNIVRSIDFGDAQGLLYIVMEYIDGVPLQRVIRGRPVKLEFALEVVAQMCGPLIEAHEAGVVHRDIKPDNVFVVRGPDDSMRIKVLDFGIARVDRPHGSDLAANLTQQGMVFGTPEYMSPEQARGFTVDHASDMYAVGVLLFELLSGELPLMGLSPMETMIMQIRDRPPDLRTRAPHVPEDVADLVARLLEKDPGKRLSDARELKRIVEKIRREHQLWPPGDLPAGDIGLVLEREFVHSPSETPRPAGVEKPRSPVPDEQFRPTQMGVPAARPPDGIPATAILYAIGSAALLVAALIIAFLLTK